MGEGAFGAAVEEVRAGAAVDHAAYGLLAKLTPDEKLGLLDGDKGFWAGVAAILRKGYNAEPVVAGAVPRLGIPGIRFTDGPRGVAMGRSTCFPVAMARGATWDPELERRIGEAIGREARAQGANLFAGVCVNLLRHPAWGRAQETYGEDPLLLGAMGAALAEGAQRHVMACVKHYALNSIENARFKVDVEVDEDDLHEAYLPHFRAVVDAGVASVMSAYNAVDGSWCGDSHELLTDILRDEWGFDGFTISDFIWGLRDPVGSVAAGLDVEMPFRQQRARALPKAVADGRLAWEDVDRAAARVVATQLRFAAATGDEAPPASVVAGPEHRALAREAAARSIALLRNEPVDGRPLLPLDVDALDSVALIGRLTATPNTGDRGSSNVHPPHVVTPLEGLTAGWPDVAVAHEDGRDPARAARAAADADVAIVVVGYTAADEGEYVLALDEDAVRLMPPPANRPWVARLAGWAMARAGERGVVAGGDRERLALRADDEALIAAVAAANPRTIVAVMAGSAVLMEAFRDRVPALLMTWYPGMEGGHALADVLAGRAEPGGRLPFAVPTDPAHLPHFDRDARSIRYDRWWGQRKLDRDGNAPAFPFGFGLGYTRFSIGDPAVTLDAAPRQGAPSAAAVGGIAVTVTVSNVGDRDGDAVVQVYAGPEAPDERMPRRQLVGFERVRLAAGESRRTEVDASLAPLCRRDRATRTWSVAPGRYRVETARHAGDPDAAVTTVEVA